MYSSSARSTPEVPPPPTDVPLDGVGVVAFITRFAVDAAALAIERVVRVAAVVIEPTILTEISAVEELSCSVPLPIILAFWFKAADNLE